jgi:glycosyltransferase involved in cell wall biosynthesis
VNVCIVQKALGKVSETFIHAHAERLPANVTVVHGLFATIGDQPTLSDSTFDRIKRKLWRRKHGYGWEEGEATLSFLRAFRQARAHVVLAHYGPVGVRVMEACRLAGLPLVVHFHGYDVTTRDIVDPLREPYKKLFRQASAIVAVSRRMVDDLRKLGAPAHKIRYNPSGVDCSYFQPANPETVGPVFLSAGRFVEKKGPHLTLLAFARLLSAVPEARLRMIGDGVLLPSCKDLVRALRIEHAVEFFGAQPHSVVRDEMARARCFVQHSVEAVATGDCEGTPNAVMEAGAAGLPVVATNHAGIPDVVIDGETGLLVREWDIDGMSAAMATMAREGSVAAAMGLRGRQRVCSEFTVERSIATQWSILCSCIPAPQSAITGDAQPGADGA